MSESPTPSSSSRDALKYPRGVGARVPPQNRPLKPLEWIVIGHVSVLLIGTTWAFGGMADFVKLPIAWWGSLGLLLTLTALQDGQGWRDGRMRPLWWLWPLIAFNALVCLATLNPSARLITVGGAQGLAITGGHGGWPSSVRPDLALRALWMFDALWISCFNIALVLHQRRAVRLLLGIVVTNAAALAVFGTVQKLAHAKGIYFDAFPTPQIYFFASFVYHNHWGAFMVLMLAGCLALTWHFGRRKEARDFFHTPAFGGIVVLLVLAVTVPLSGSRSSTVLVIVLLGGAFLHWVVRLAKIRRQYRESITLPLLGAVAAVALALGGTWFVAGSTIKARLSKTQEQLTELRVHGVGDRSQLYGNTWRMAKDKLWFGWGMASYPHVFSELYNTRKSRDRLPVFYNDAHNDWLQSLAEHGVIGSLLLALTAIVPLLRLRHRHFTSYVPGYLLAGCALVLIYAWVEFPFGNVANVLTWWLCFFCAVHYARLQDREAPAPVKSSPT